MNLFYLTLFLVYVLLTEQAYWFIKLCRYHIRGEICILIGFFIQKKKQHSKKKTNSVVFMVIGIGLG